MIKIDKRYKIKFSYGGVIQYAEFKECKWKSIYPDLLINWAKSGDVPDVSKCKNINEVLEKIKSVSYGGRAEIDTINGHPIFYYKKLKTQKMIKDMKTYMDIHIRCQADLFFDTELKPLLIKNKWKISNSSIGMLILISKNKEGIWDNVKDTKKEFEFEYLCEKFLSAMNINNSKFKTTCFLNLIDDLKEFYLDPDMLDVNVLQDC